MPHENTPEYRLSRDVRHRTVGAEGIILRQKDGEIVVINEVATRILGYVGQDLDSLSIVDELHREYEADKEVLAADVDSLLAEFEQLGVVERV